MAIGDTNYGELSFRYGTLTALTASNPTLDRGEPIVAFSGTEIILKVGDGTRRFNDLPNVAQPSGPAGTHSHVIADISNDGVIGAQLLAAATAAQARGIIQAGTSSLVIGTTGADAAAGNHTHSQYLTQTQVDDRIVALVPGLDVGAGVPVFSNTAAVTAAIGSGALVDGDVFIVLAP